MQDKCTALLLYAYIYISLHTHLQTPMHCRTLRTTGHSSSALHSFFHCSRQVYCSTAICTQHSSTGLCTARHNSTAVHAVHNSTPLPPFTLLCTALSSALQGSKLYIYAPSSQLPMVQFGASCRKCSSSRSVSQWQARISLSTLLSAVVSCNALQRVAV